MTHQRSEVTVKKRNPIAASFASGINRAQIVPGKRNERRVKHRLREFEALDDG